jgi:hypothetical protein
MAQAASFLGTGTPLRFSAEENVDGLTAYLATLEQVLEQTEAGAGRGAGFGRSDELLLARADLARSRAMLAMARGKDLGALDSLNQAIGFAQQAFDARLDFHGNGTASLYELTHVWQMQQELVDNVRTVKEDVPEGLISQQRDRLSQLHQVAADTADLRGRNAADIRLVESLETLRDLTDWRDTRKTARSSKIVPAVTSPPSGT